MLVLLAKQCTDQGTRFQEKNHVFKNKMKNTNERIAEKITVHNLRESFKDMHGLYCLASIDEDYIHGLINIMDDKEIYASTIQVLILNNLNNDNENIYKNLEIDGYTFEPRVVIGSHYMSGVKWDRTLYSRHVGSSFSSWFKQRINYNIPL